jgi:mono/diheme cytochrome c family protein
MPSFAPSSPFASSTSRADRATLRRVARGLALTATLLLAVALTGCEKTLRNMYQQPKLQPLAASPLWPDGAASRPDVPGTVAASAGRLAGASSGRVDRDTREPITRTDVLAGAHTAAADRLALLRRGRERYDIYCSPCHSITGDGDGFIVRRGFPRPPSFHQPALRAESDATMLGVIRDGAGTMFGFGDRVDAFDREAIVAYIRALQLARNAQPGDVPPEHRAELGASPP